MALLDVMYATDENMRVRLGPDFFTLAPRDQRIAHGTDGEFDVSDRWTLTSASVDFEAQGVAAGMVVQLVKRDVFAQPSESFAVDAVDGSSATLRRIGQAAGLGQPPGPVAGTTGVTFTIVTLSPQIEDASYDINRRFGVDPVHPGRTPGDFYDLREVRQATVLTAAHRQYLAMAREASEGDRESYYGKAASYKAELDDTLARLVVHWQAMTGSGTQVAEPSSSRFGTRISR